MFVAVLQTPKCLPSDTSVNWIYTEPHDTDFISSAMLSEPGDSSNVLKRDALCLKYASNLTSPYS